MVCPCASGSRVHQGLWSRHVRRGFDPMAVEHRPITDSSADEVCRRLAELCQPLESESVSLAAALGRRLREAVRAPEDLPPFDRSAMDGYAIRQDDPSTRFRIVDRLRAGDYRPRSLQPGQAVAIATGAALPAPHLQVVPRELVIESGEEIELRQRPTETFIRFRGQDARANDLLVPEGTLLQPGAIALLASLGHTHPTVTRRPRVLHLVTGNELVEAAHRPGPGQIRDSNSFLVHAFFQRWGVIPQQFRCPEDESTCCAVLQPRLESDRPPDLLLISGGASVGPHDFTRHLLEQSGFEILLHRVRARPGRPLLVARRGRMLAFGLPGNPLAHFVCLHLYVGTVLAAWDGADPAIPDWRPGLLAVPLQVESSPYETFWPAHWQINDAGRAELLPLSWQSSGDLTPLARANALLRVPGPTTGPIPQTEVWFLPLDGIS